MLHAGKCIITGDPLSMTASRLCVVSYYGAVVMAAPSYLRALLLPYSALGLCYIVSGYRTCCLDLRKSIYIGACLLYYCLGGACFWVNALGLQIPPVSVTCHCSTWAIRSKLPNITTIMSRVLLLPIYKGEETSFNCLQCLPTWSYEL